MTLRSKAFTTRPNTTALEAQRIGLRVIRDAVGPDVYLDKDGSPMLNTVGLTELGRLSTDTGHSFEGDKEDAPGIAARYYMNGNFYGADPDAFTVAGQLITDQTWHQSKTPLSQDDAEVSIALAAVAGGMFELGDDLPTMGAEPERIKLVENKDLLDMVRLQRSSKPLDLMTYSREDGQPSIFFPAGGPPASHAGGLQLDRRCAVAPVQHERSWLASRPCLRTHGHLSQRSFRVV